MKVKFEAENQKDLQDFYEFLYDKYPEIIVDEENAISPGTHKEPIVTALVIIISAVGGKKLLPILQQCYKEYLEYKKHKISVESEIIKTSILEKTGWKYKKGNDFIEMKIDQ